MKATIRKIVLLFSLVLFSASASAFDVGGFVNGVIEGVSDSFQEAKGKPGAHEKGKNKEAQNSDESASATEQASESSEAKD